MYLGSRVAKRRNSARQTGHQTAWKNRKAGLRLCTKSSDATVLPSRSTSSKSGMRLPTFVPVSANDGGAEFGIFVCSIAEADVGGNVAATSGFFDVSRFGSVVGVLISVDRSVDD